MNFFRPLSLSGGPQERDKDDRAAQEHEEFTQN